MSRPTPKTDKSLRHGSHPTPLELDTDHLPSLLTPDDHIFERNVCNTRTTFGIKEELAVYHRRIVTNVRYDPQQEKWVWEFADREPASESFVKRLADSNDPSIRSYPPPRMPDFPRPTDSFEPDHIIRRWECTPQSPPELSGSPKQLTFRQVRGQGSRDLVNRLLAGGPDGEFDHILPGVQKWRYAFVATANQSPYSVSVLAQPYNSDTGQGTGEHTLYLTRLCNHPHAPPNTSSWHLARVRDWLTENTTVKRLVAIAGIDDNQGTCYKAAGFAYDGYSKGTNRWGESWTRHRWVYRLDDTPTYHQQTLPTQ